MKTCSASRVLREMQFETNEISLHRCCNCWLMIPIQYSYMYFLCLFQCVYVCACLGGGSQRGRERQRKRERDCMFTGHRTSLGVIPRNTIQPLFQTGTLSGSHQLGWTGYSVRLPFAEITLGHPMPQFLCGFYGSHSGPYSWESNTIH